MVFLKTIGLYLAVAFGVCALTIAMAHISFHALIFQQSLSAATTDFFHNFDFGIPTILWFVWPYAALTLITGRLLKKSVTKKYAPLFFAVFLIFVTVIYSFCIFDSQNALYTHAWTAAALSLGLMPFLAMPILIVAIFVMFFMRRNIA